MFCQKCQSELKLKSTASHINDVQKILKFVLIDIYICQNLDCELLEQDIKIIRKE